MNYLAIELLHQVRIGTEGNTYKDKLASSMQMSNVKCQNDVLGKK